MRGNSTDQGVPLGTKSRILLWIPCLGPVKQRMLDVPVQCHLSQKQMENARHFSVYRDTAPQLNGHVSSIHQATT